MTDVCTCRTIALSGWDTVQQAVDPTCQIHATYTASEVKVLTETASKVAYALGRKDAGEEIAEALEALAEAIGEGDQREFCIDFADTARDIASRPPQAASDATSGVPGHPEVSEAPRSPQEPYECSCYKLPRWSDGLLRHHPECPNATEGDTP